ncbi:MAG TPA: hypothetical protein VEX62_13525 [Candidatus Limnocylindrales bacterium]|nr:hypothetical protein [Candidatus Limnocylindrales bacterium]
MADRALVEALPFAAWIILVTLAFGSFLFMVIARHWARPTIGYMRFSSVFAAALAGLALLTDNDLTPGPALAITPAPPELDALRLAGVAAFGVLALVDAFVVRRPRASIVVGAATLVAAGVALGAAAFGWAPSSVDAVPFLVQLCVLTAVTGGSVAAVVLSHWYLVTPKLPEAPLILQSRLLIATLVLQILLFIVWTTLGGGPGQVAFSAFNDSLLLVIMRLVITLIFPLVLCYMALRTAQTRSMESATGLLYINLAAVMAGTIGAAALYVSSGLLV